MALQTKLGLNFTLPDSHVKLRLKNYVSLDALPTPPAVFGHESAIVTWKTLGNDTTSDCAWAGAAHEHMLWTGEHGKPVVFETANVLSDYSKATGYDPNNATNTDNGTDMIEAAKYRQQLGIIDSSGTRHKIDSYVALTPGNVAELMAAAWLFSAVGVGVRFPQSADDQFSEGEPWDVVSGSPIIGGHYIPIIGRNSHGLPLLVTWGRLHAMTLKFYTEFCMTTLAYISHEMVDAKGLTPEQFNLDQLIADQKRL
jgi:hypothetical protein